MKKVFFVIALFCVMSVHAQDYPGESVNLLGGKELIVMNLDATRQKYGYPNFYTDEALKKTYKRKDLYTKYDALSGKKFKVISYKPMNSYTYVLELNNKETGTLYYKYKTDSDHDYYFEAVGGLDYPEDFFCKKLKPIGGKFTDEIRDGLWQKNASGYATPFIEDIQCTYYPTQANKYNIQISITESSTKKETGLKGVVLLLDNNTEVNIPDADVLVSPANGMYRYGTIVHLNDSQLLQLQQNKIVKVRLASYEKEIKSGKLIQHYLKCFGK